MLIQLTKKSLTRIILIKFFFGGQETTTPFVYVTSYIRFITGLLSLQYIQDIVMLNCYCEISLTLERIGIFRFY